MVEKIVFDFDPENAPYKPGLRDPESIALTGHEATATPNQSKGVAKTNRKGNITC